MIGVIFQFVGETVMVRIEGTNVLFRTSRSIQFADISGIKLDKKGVFKEFPDLKDKEDWKEQAQERFKMKIKELKDEQERAQYVIDDLQKYGYVPLYTQKRGFRPVKIGVAN